jgi:hypothetical protein
MIQVSQRHLNGSIKYCRIHDLLRDLAIEKGKENRFLDIIKQSQGEYFIDSSSTITLNVRRATLQCDHKDIIEYTGPNLRSLLFFGDHLPNVERFRLLKVLNGRHSKGMFPYTEIKGDIFNELAQLRYLGIPKGFQVCAHYRSTFWAERQFWKRISRMRNLQTLDISSVEMDSASFDFMWDIKTLRHVILRGGYYGPPSRTELPNLQTLKYVAVRAEWFSKGWPTLANLRVLRLYEFPSNYGESFHTFLSELHHLTSLHVYSSREENVILEYEMWDMSALPCYDHLQSLSVGGEWTKMHEQDDVAPLAITTTSFPIHLTKLKLYDSRIEEDPMPVLEKLQSLRRLELHEDAYVGRQLCCSAGGFLRLQFLALGWLRKLEEWKWNWKADVEGPMPMPILKDITLYECPKLRLIPGLRHMSSLTNFTSVGRSPELDRSLREDESHKIRDGQFIQFNGSPFHF